MPQVPQVGPSLHPGLFRGDGGIVADVEDQPLGGTLQTPVLLAPVQWCMGVSATNYGPASYAVMGGRYTYANGTNGVGATMTATVNGVLSIDGGQPAVGDRVVVADNYSNYIPNGVYTVTSVGSASTPWVMTRSTDCDTSALLGRFWTVEITNGTYYGQGQAGIASLSLSSGAFIVGTDLPCMWVTGANTNGQVTGGIALNGWAGLQAYVAPTSAATVALAYNSVGLGNQCAALGPETIAGGEFSVAIGDKSISANNWGVALGQFCGTYSPCQTATVAVYHGNFSGSSPGYTGRGQASQFCLGCTTTSATQTQAYTDHGDFIYFCYIGNNAGALGTLPDFTKTLIVRGYVVARRTDVPGTDSAWSFQGVLRGDGSSTYTWVGGSAPSMTLIAQDAGASTWIPAIAYTTSGSDGVIECLATGAASETIDWAFFVYTEEVS